MRHPDQRAGPRSPTTRAPEGPGPSWYQRQRPAFLRSLAQASPARKDSASRQDRASASELRRTEGRPPRREHRLRPQPGGHGRDAPVRGRRRWPWRRAGYSRIANKTIRMFMFVSHEDCLGIAVGPLLRSFATRCACHPAGTRGPSERSATARADRPVLMGRLALSALHIEREHRGNRTRARKMTAIELQDPLTGPTAERPHRPQSDTSCSPRTWERRPVARPSSDHARGVTTRCSRSSPWRRRTTNGWHGAAHRWSGAAHARRASATSFVWSGVRPTPSSRRPGPNDPTS